MKKFLMIHGYNGISPLFYWIKDELEKMGHDVIMPSLPTREGCRYEIWAEEMGKIDLSGELVVIAHSAGNPFIIKYFSDRDLEIKLYIGLAGCSDKFSTEGREDLMEMRRTMLPSESELEKFKSGVAKKYCIFSDNDHLFPLEILEKHAENIGGVPIMIPNVGHMGGRSGIKELPQVIEIVKENE